ncbi:G-type lectin S-receptor-like serine/threonine-protein kinase At4g27290 [Rhododendron vialii]|uniref:G-type lectin S-receptor-like serine/threonine-protein kinase At4g27290 n=1 Tax=Rhododendron vialii TaxID=182163 RepID=UPI00265E3904|nr:G-type lectin S-receptor-like serine/threonine-protein kinase At4g27290 [Rhododendron vialii]
MEGFVIPLCVLSLLFSILITSNGVDTITTAKSLTDGETIVSSSETFELGFFTPGASKNRYVGIWYRAIYYKEITGTAVLWVANRETPLFDTSGVLKLTSQGILVLVNGTNDTIWSINASRSAQDPVAQLFNNFNMVVRNADDEVKAENLLWQSFDYPGNTLLQGMKLGKNFLTGQEWYISSWKSDNDPGEGAFTFVLDMHGYPQMFLRKGTADYLYGSGPGNGLRFRGISDSNQIFRFNYDLILNYDLNMEEVYYTFDVPNASVATRTVLSSEGYVGQWTWVDQTRGWISMARAPEAGCDMYASCGSYGICNIVNTSMCGCLDKFVPVNPREWELGDWSNGCVRRTPLGCHEGGEDGFVKYSAVKLANTRNSSFDKRMSLEECQTMCLRNCSCMAYANLDISEAGSGCLLWFD